MSASRSRYSASARGVIAPRGHLQGDAGAGWSACPGGRGRAPAAGRRARPGTRPRPRRDRPARPSPRRCCAGWSACPGGRGRAPAAGRRARRGARPRPRRDPPAGHLEGDLVPGGQRVRVVGAEHPQLVGEHVPVLGLGRGVIPPRGHPMAMLFRVVSVSGWSGPSTRSLSASTSRCRPRPRRDRPAGHSRAMLCRVASVSGWSGPSTRSLVGQHVPVFGLGRGVIPPLGHLQGDLVPGGQRVRVVGAEHPQPGGQHVPVLGLGRGVSPPGPPSHQAM